jgi:dCMP deaminase
MVYASSRFIFMTAQTQETATKYVRPSWDEYFMEIARAVAKRATCDRGRVGCVIARDKQILVTGYAGAPRGMPHCDEVGHQMKTVTHEDGHQSQHCMRTAHAEQNAIVQASKVGVSIDGGTCYCKMTPCAACARMMINAGIKRIVCEKRYHAGQETEAMFKEVGIAITFFDDSIEPYARQ